MVAEADGRAVASLVGYALPDQPEPIDHDRMPAMFAPLQELENLAPRTWYVNVLAAYPEYRGRGYGTRLLGSCQQLGAEPHRLRRHAGARRLHERCSYGDIVTRPIVKERWQAPGTNWGPHGQAVARAMKTDRSETCPRNLLAGAAARTIIGNKLASELLS